MTFAARGTTEYVYTAVVRRYRTSLGLPVTVREIQADCRLSSSSVAWYHVNKLVMAGRVLRTPGIARSIRPAPGVGE